MRDPSTRLPTVQGRRNSPLLDGDDLRHAFEAATRCLEKHRDAVNALNVFPVPDGDTGTNMLLTMRSVNQGSQRAPSSSAGAVMSSMAEGALWGARGNSGVILSQFFQGMATGLQGKEALTGEDLAQAFGLASEATYRSVSKPVDGTMLTVIRELSLGARNCLAGGTRDCLAIWRLSLDEAKTALCRTPLQLPILREAGVVDAGGQGVVIILQGAFWYLAGENVDELEMELSVPTLTDTTSSDAPRAQPSGKLGRTPASLPTVAQDFLESTEEELYGYCAQFLIQGQALDRDKIRKRLSSLAGSTVVVGNDSLVKIHVHAYDPGPVISYAVSLGTLDQVSIDNMDQQHKGFMALHRGVEAAASDADSSEARDRLEAAPAETTMTMVSVAWGDGFARLLRELGSPTVVTGGQTMNPSTEELLAAARESGATEAILLPNNPNIIPAAQQAAAIAGNGPTHGKGGAMDAMRLHVVPSRTIPQGVAALLAFNPEGSLASNLESMEKALATVITIEVTTAVRQATVNGMAVKEGQYLGLLDGALIAAGDSALAAFQQALAIGGLKAGQLLTIYWGGEVDEAQANDAAAHFREGFAGADVEVVYGGQPYYHYIASVE